MTWGTDHTACFKFVGDDWENCDCVHAGSNAWVYRRYCGGTAGMVYYGDSVDYQNLPDACTS